MMAGARAVPAQAPSFAPVGMILGPADLIEAQGHHLYVAANDTLTVFDVSSPATPVRQGTYKFPEKIWGLTAVRDRVYAAVDFFGLGILDVSDPKTPRLLGSLKTPGQAKNVAVSGTTAAVADHVSGVDLIDVFDPAKPLLLGSVYLDGYARDVATLGSRAYAVDNPTGLYVIDLSKPAAADPESALQSATMPRVIKVSPGSAPNGPSLAVLLGAGSLQVFDLSNPAQPVHASTFRLPGAPGVTLASSPRLALRGRLAYVAAAAEGLQVVDLSDSSKPRIVRSYKADSPVRDVAVTDSLVFAVVGQLRRVNTTPLGAVVGPREVPHGDVLVLRQSR